MSAGRSTRRHGHTFYAFAGPAPIMKTQHGSHVDLVSMVLLASLILIIVVGLSDPVIVSALTHLAGVAWSSTVSFVAQR